MSAEVGALTWVIPEGYVPGWSHGPAPQMTSHGAACILNAGAHDARVEITLYFTDSDPVGPYRLTVGAQRTKHVRFNELNDPAPVPTGVPFASVIRSTHPIVVQHTRLDSRQAECALMTTLAYAADSV